MSALWNRIDPDGSLLDEVRKRWAADPSVWSWANGIVEVLSERGLLRGPGEPTLAEIRRGIERLRDEALASSRRCVAGSASQGLYSAILHAHEDDLALLEPRQKQVLTVGDRATISGTGVIVAMTQDTVTVLYRTKEIERARGEA